jgi:O-antigen/teichoic acid export membrane protein
MFKTVIYSSIISYFTALFSFLSTMIIAKNIHIDTFGIITLGLAIGAFIQILLNFASDKIFVKEIINQKLNASAYAIIQIIFQLFILTAIIIIYLFINLNNYQDNLLLYVIIWFSLIGIYPKGLYDYKEKVLQNTVLHLLERLLSFVVIFLFMISQNIDIKLLEELFKVLILIRIIFVALQIIFIFKNVLLNDYKYSFQSFKKNIKKRIYIVIALLSNSIILYGLQIMTKINLDYKSIAIYGLAIQLTLIVIIVQSQIIRHLNKKIFLETKNNKLDIVLFNRTLKLSIYISLPLSILMLMLSYLLETYYLDNSYYSLFNISIILTLWLNVLGAGTIISQYFISLINEKSYLYINLTGGILSIFFAFFAFKIFGIYTAPLVLLVVHSSIIFTQYIFIIKRNYNAE